MARRTSGVAVAGDESERARGGLEDRGASSELSEPQAAPEGNPSRLAATSRLITAGIMAACVGILGVAGWLRPDPRGFGTHEQLGAAPCGLLAVTKLPCPTCGMTTAFAYTVRGRWFSAFLAQPAGFILALGVAATAVISLRALVTGRWPMFFWDSLTPYRAFLGLLVLLLGGWGFKLAMAVMQRG